MAEAAGVRLVRIAQRQRLVGRRRQPMFARMEMAAAPPVPVMPGQQAVDRQRVGTWEIAPQ